MTTPIRVLGISGSLRKHSINSGLLYAAADMLPDGMTLEIADISQLPLYNGDQDGEHAPQAVVNFKEQIVAADALLIATPEYNHSVTGALKNALDWASRPMGAAPLNDKPTAIMGAGGVSGTLRAQLHLRQILFAVGAQTLNRPEVMIARAWEKFDANGTLKDEESRKAIRALLDSLYNWTIRAGVKIPA